MPHDVTHRSVLDAWPAGAALARSPRRSTAETLAGVAAIAIYGLALFFACGRAGAGVALSFTGEDPGWTPGFADHPKGAAADGRYQAGVRDVPLPLESSARALFIAGDNPGRALRMYWKRPLAALEPGATYAATVEVSFVSEAPHGCAGPAGAPGDDVRLEVGLLPAEPAGVAGAGGFVRASFEGETTVLGSIATRTRGCRQRTWERRTLATGAPLAVRASEDGTAWLVVGTDSSYAGRTLVYYERVSVRLQRVAPALAARAR